MFVPRCCEQTCNLRAYSKDADFLMLAERRAAFFSDIGGGASIVNDADSVTIKAEAGYVWVGYMTPDGYVVTDGEAEVLISRDVWNAEKQAGEWAYEMGQCRANTSTNADTTSGFNAFVFGSQLHITYKKSSAATFPNCCGGGRSERT